MEEVTENAGAENSARSKTHV